MSALIVDTDCGVDDAEALLLALSLTDSELDLLGVCCVHGNTSLDNVCSNVLRVLKIASRQVKQLLYYIYRFTLLFSKNFLR